MGVTTNNVLVKPDYSEPVLSPRWRTIITVCVESAVQIDRAAVARDIADEMNAQYANANPESPRRDFRIAWCNAEPTERI